MKHLVAMQPQVLWYLLTPALVMVMPPVAAAVSDIAPSAAPGPGCPSKCGDVDIPYPFGVDDNACSWNGEFTVTCNHSFSPPRPYAGNIEIMNISVETSEMRVYTPVSYICYNSSDTTESVVEAAWSYDLTNTPLRISPTRNIFTAIGCNTLALLRGREDWSYFTGCITYCASLDEAAHDGDRCTGLGCCQTSIPGNLSKIAVDWNNGTNTANPAWSYSPCSYAFVASEEWYHFRQKDLIGSGKESFKNQVGERTIPMVLDWAISDGSCPPPSKTGGKPMAPACASSNSYCLNTTQGHGYLCNCSEGYHGNPYIPGSCTDINECELRKLDPVKYKKLYPCGSGSTCQNMPGGYKCKCKFGHRGVGKSERGCRPIFPGYATAIVAILVALLLLVLLLWFVRKEHKRRLRRGFFDKNGGKLLKGGEINIYTEERLNKITNQYSERIGKGNFGQVFKGTTEDNQQVAVKRTIIEGGNEPHEGGEFVHEILFQFQMRHTNLVRLVGCCLETDVPMLVFEFIPNGSLYDVLHGTDKARMLSLLERLDIGIGSAEALAYMHSRAGHKRIHGDVKSGNILLDDDLLPKVSDFGSSKIVSSKCRYVRFVASDINYVDPVYMKTDRFTEKSDVYSFGVVLLELITRKEAKYDGNNSLPLDFVKCFKVDGNGRKMYDRDVLTSDDAKSHVYMECLDRIGGLAVRCIKEDEDERPTMAEVVEELNQVKAIAFGSSGSEAN